MCFYCIDSTILDGGRGRDHFSNSSGDHNFQVKMVFVSHVLLHSSCENLHLFIQVKEGLDALIKMREALQDEV